MNSMRRYRLSEKGLLAEKRYRQSSKGKAAAKRFRNTLKGKISLKKGYEKYRRTPHGRYMIAKKDAQRRYKWEISENVYTKLMEQKCYYCKLSLPIFGIGLDRLDSSRYYTEDNVVPCCEICNKVKGNWWTSEETKIAVQAVFEFRRTWANSSNIISKC